MATNGTVFVVNDVSSTRHWLASLLSDRGMSAETYANAEDWLAEYRGFRPAGCFLLEISLPGMGGLELQQQLRQQEWHIPVVFFTRCGAIETVVRAMKAGAVNFLQEPADPEAILAAVKEAMHLDSLFRESQAHKARIRSCLDLLSAREREVLRHVVAGKSSKRIADELYLSDKTVQLHRAHIMRKTGAGNVAELVSLVNAVESRNEIHTFTYLELAG